MGEQRRLRALALLAFAASWTACGDEQTADVAERRRELLRPPDVSKIKAERAERTRIVSEDGALLESDEVVAGVRLPRGFELKLALPEAWYYHSEHVTFEQLDEYFKTRMFTARIERDDHSVRYDAARPRDDPKAPFVTLRIGVVPSDRRKQEIYIRRPDPERRRPIMSAAEARAEIEAARRVAE